MKIDGYIRQDKKADRVLNNDDYIDLNWFLTEMSSNPVCACCKAPYKMFLDNGNVQSNITADRIDNSLSHTSDNCRLMCVDCNRKRSNKNNIIYM